MGIQGLLPTLKSIMAPVHVKELSGQTVAVDTYSWLHKGAFSCSREICKGLPTSRYVDYCMHRVNLLRHFGIKPILVFDGGLLPMKTDQEARRSKTRKENLERALEHESAGNTSAAYECFQKAVDISPSIAHHLIQVLKKENVDFIVAPYEADAQMTFLVTQKFADAVITEDSDLIPFGCSRIIYKMDKFGQGTEFRCSLLGQNRELNFSDFSQQMFLEMCILSGCDYLQSLPGMGLKRAHALIQKFKSYDKVIKHLKYSSVSVPPLYEENFKKAIWTFKHQRVYNPMVEDIVHLSDIPSDFVEDDDFLGPPLPQHVMKGIANGFIDPLTKMPFEVDIIQVASVPDKSYALKEVKRTNERKKIDLPVKKNLLTNYFCLASIEAKRKYKAPQVNGKQLPLTKESANKTNNKNNLIAKCMNRDDESEEATVAVPSKKPRLSPHFQAGRISSVQVPKASSPSQKCDEQSKSTQKSEEKKEKRSFQCDISHLDRYSGIAEKSMEKFVAAISSFRYVPSGSRASGLRPPLRELKNVNAIGSRSSVSPTKI